MPTCTICGDHADIEFMDGTWYCETHDPTPPDDTGQWEQIGETRQTWAGNIAIDQSEHGAILRVQMVDTVTWQLRIPYAKLESLIAELDWAREKLRPWPALFREEPAPETHVSPFVIIDSSPEDPS